ncbi:MAG: hypothetical protein RL662_821 [Bacteroidota bacterium]|jgi:uncharacterized protein (TIGR01777 family)
MNIFITGATGLIGSILVENLLERGDKVAILTRDVVKARRVFGDEITCYTSIDDLTSLNGYDAIINLVGESIADKRWTSKQKQKLCHSRCDITQKITALVKASQNPPSVFISGSAVGYYGKSGEAKLTEDSPFHDEFTHQLCKQWENLALDAASDKTRVCISRTGIVLSSKGGMLPKMALPFRYGLGAIVGSGNQYISWIHIADMVDALLFLLDTPQASGVFNLTSPDPCTNRIFSKTVSRILNRPCLLKIPSFILYLLMGEVATLLVDGQRVVPDNLTKLGYRFGYPYIRHALEDILE